MCICPQDKNYRLFAIIGHDHRGCDFRLNNLKRVLEYYSADGLIKVVLVTNIADLINQWNFPHVDLVQHQQIGEYSHNETLMIGMEHTPDDAIVALIDGDIIYSKGSLLASLNLVSQYSLVSPLGAMHFTSVDHQITGSCIPAGNILGPKKILQQLVEEIGGNNIRGWGAEDVALLIAARQRGLLPKRHYVETLHYWHPEASKKEANHVLDSVCKKLGLPALTSLQFRLEALKPAVKPQGYFNAIRGLGSAHYLSELCSTDKPLEVHVLSDGKNDFLGQVHYAGIRIHDDNLPCEHCAMSDEVGKEIWVSCKEIANHIQTTEKNILHNLWYATLGLGWSMATWQHVRSLAYGGWDDLKTLESLAHAGLATALTGKAAKAN